MPGLNLKIITPERVVFNDVVDNVIACGTDGQFEVLPGHEPLVATLAVDVLKYRKGREEHFAAVMGGVLEVHRALLDEKGELLPANASQEKLAGATEMDEITILSNVAELDTEIDATRAHAAKERAQAEKEQKIENLPVYVTEMAMSKAMARIRASELRQVRRKPQS